MKERNSLITRMKCHVLFFLTYQTDWKTQGMGRRLNNSEKERKRRPTNYVR